MSLALGVHMTGEDGGGIRIALGWPGIQYLIYAVWLVPLGTRHADGRAAFLPVPVPHRTRGQVIRLIFQITTTGREEQRVNEVIGQIRSYRLVMSHEIWVVTEPVTRQYPLADRVLTVPAEFTARSERKARALEYSRQVRVALGLDAQT